MSQLESLSVEGLRSIVDSGIVEIKPFNILVGTNSSGKSTFLRLFPLIRQSVEKRTRGPILWNGDFTDFESFENSINSNLTNGKDPRIKLGFKFKIPASNRYPIKNKEDVSVTANICIAKGKAKFTSFTDRYTITIDDDDLEFIFKESGELTSVTSKRISWLLAPESELKYQHCKPTFLNADLSEYADDVLHEHWEIIGMWISQRFFASKPISI